MTTFQEKFNIEDDLYKSEKMENIEKYVHRLYYKNHLYESMGKDYMYFESSMLCLYYKFTKKSLIVLIEAADVNNKTGTYRFTLKKTTERKSNNGIFVYQPKKQLLIVEWKNGEILEFNLKLGEGVRKPTKEGIKEYNNFINLLDKND